MRFPAHKVSVLDIAGDKVTYNKVDLPTGQWPYNVVVTPDRKIALTADNGGAGASDGSVDTVSVIDLEAGRRASPTRRGRRRPGGPRCPQGRRRGGHHPAGSNNPKAYYHKKNGSVSVLKIDGKKVTKIGDIEVGGLPEAADFTPDGKYMIVGNYLDQDLSILKVDGSNVTDTGKRFKVPGHPASARMSR